MGIIWKKKKFSSYPKANVSHLWHAILEHSPAWYNYFGDYKIRHFYILSKRSVCRTANPLHIMKSPHSSATRKSPCLWCPYNELSLRIPQSHQEVRNLQCVVVKLQATSTWEFTDLIATCNKYLDPLETDLEMSKKISCLRYLMYKNSMFPFRQGHLESSFESQSSPSYRPVPSVAHVACTYHCWNEM